MAARFFVRAVSRRIPSKLIKRIQWIQAQTNPSSQTTLINHLNRISPIRALLAIAIGAVAAAEDVAVSLAVSRTPGHKTLVRDSNRAFAVRDSLGTVGTTSRTVATRAGRAAAGAEDAEPPHSLDRWITATATPMVEATLTVLVRMGVIALRAFSSRILSSLTFRPSKTQKRARPTRLSALLTINSFWQISRKYLESLG